MESDLSQIFGWHNNITKGHPVGLNSFNVVHCLNVFQLQVKSQYYSFLF